MLILLFMKLACIFQSQRMELHQVNQLTDQSRREKCWLCDELEMRETAFQEDRVTSYQEIEELRRICSTEAAENSVTLKTASSTGLSQSTHE